MRIRIWNAYASNNSGSYTLVGRFESVESASTFAEELAEICRTHNQWCEQPWGDRRGEPPLAQLIAREKLSSDPQEGTRDDWPDHDEPPEVTQLGRQVMLHVDWTVTMPRAFGELIYRRGGRVETEIDHAHVSIGSRFELWAQDRSKEGGAPKKQAFIAEVGHVLAPQVERRHDWQKTVPLLVADGEWEHSVRVGAVFNDLVAGTKAIEALARKHDMGIRMHVFELTSADPFEAHR